jgi:mono/diheme cytochrome c family protein
MFFGWWIKRLAQLAVCGISLAISGAAFAQETNQSHGVIATFKSGTRSDSSVLPNFWLYIPKNEPATPFLEGTDYTVELSSLISVDLRGNYQFCAELNGQLTLEINGATALELSGNIDKLSDPGKTVRLNKGTNAIIARFTPPKEGDAMLRLFWVPKDVLPSLIPDSALTYIATPELKHGLSLRHGRQLFAEFRCAKCHKTDLAGMPELAADAPALDDIAARLHPEWIARWIQNPAENRNSARMPQVFHDASNQESSAKIASYFASLSKPATPASTSGDVEKGQHLFQALHCGACHNTPGSDEKDPARISLTHVKQKFQPGALKTFLLNPAAHYAWIRMPNFKFSLEEASNLTAFLESKAAASLEPLKNADGAVAEGKKLFENSGCLNCHSNGKEQTSFSTIALADLIKGNLASGCLNPEMPGKAPKFSFTGTALQDLRAFLKSETASLARDNAREFAVRQTELLNCAGCHGKFEGFPALNLIGGKLKPEWSAEFIGGKVNYKPRPWLESRMPAFTNRAPEIAHGLALLHGYPTKTPAEPPIDKDMSEVGRKLVSPIGGFSCISCHAVGNTAATQVFESAGINFAYSAERLLKPFYHAWVMNPLAIDPTTKMPVFFDNEGRSQLTDVYDGDAYKQIEAIWQYFRLGDKMPPPPLQ